MVRQTVEAPHRLSGELTPPGDKSVSHRAAILGSIARGDATISNFSRSADCLATVRCMRDLGASVESTDTQSVRVAGTGKAGLAEPENILDAGNSGTTMRLLAGLLAAQPWLSVITGDESLRSRPMGRIISPLRLMGATIRGRARDSRAPLAIGGGELHGIRYRLPVPSAQLKSAIMLAALYAQGATVIQEPVPSRDHTERLLKAMGADVTIAGDEITVMPCELNAVDVSVPGDFSSAAFWLVAGAIHPQARVRVANTGVNPTRTGLLEVLQSMGARIEVRNQRLLNSEPIADIEVSTSSLNGIEIGGDLVPRIIDEIPLVALAACVARGETVVRGAHELRVKESDRIGVTVSHLARMGAIIEELPDGFKVRGGKKLMGSSCDSGGDHRIAMTMAIAGLVAEGQTTIDNAEAAGISYPSFWGDLSSLSKRQQ